MKIGVPGGLMFSRYEVGIRAFFGELEKAGPIQVSYSTESGPEILSRGLANCVDEACLPIKLFHGHVVRLQEECDRVVIPRLMKCACGSSICPKFNGLPEMVKSGTGKDKGTFTGPLYLNDPKALSKMMIESGKELGIPTKFVKQALQKGNEAQREREATRLRECLPGGGKAHEIQWNKPRRLQVAILGHTYNLADPFLNRDLLQKLKKLGARPILGDSLYISGSSADRADLFGAGELMKKPYWLSFRENYGAAALLAGQGDADGVIYVSSFCCGPDSFIVDMVKKRLGDLPFLVLKLDEHTGEAGMETRLEAFIELLERRRPSASEFERGAACEGHVSAFG